MTILRLYQSVALLLCLWLAFSSPLRAHSDLRQLTFYTESYPPANFQTPQGKLAGYAVDILLEASALVEQPIDMKQIRLTPWKQAYHKVVTEPNTMLFSTARTELREPLFQWVGPIIPLKIIVLARKDADITITQPMDMAKYSIGVISDDIGEQTLLAHGIPREAMREAKDVMTLSEQLMKKRIDLIVYSQQVANWWVKSVDVDPSLFEPVYVLKEGDLYYAFHRDTDPQIIANLQRGIERLKSMPGEQGQSRYQEILAKYE